MKLSRQTSSALALAALVAFSVLASACGLSTTAPTTYAPFSKTDLVVGTGTEVVSNSTVTVDYTGWLYDASKPDSKGPQFDTSTGRTPFTVILGQGGVIQGFDQGIPGMKVGGVRRLIIPPSLAYGQTRTGIIPPNSTLVFDVTLLGVQ